MREEPIIKRKPWKGDLYVLEMILSFYRYCYSLQCKPTQLSR